MTLTKHEQSGFILETKKGFRLAFDIGNKTPIEKLDDIKSVDAFLVSHIHGDHFSIPHIKKLSPKNLYLNHECLEAVGEENLSTKITKVKTGDSFLIDEIKVSYFIVDHGPNISAPVENLGFLLEVENQTIYFAGYDPEKLEEHSALSQATKDYYKEKFGKGERPLLFVGVPHILHKGSIDISDLPIIVV